MATTKKRKKRLTNIQRLEQADPRGRVDVMAYRATKRILETVESKYQLPGLAEEMLGMAANEITKNLTDKKLELPVGSLPILKRLGIL
jgi:hypothetical protein